MLLITPADRGTCADVLGVARACHEFGVPLIVDEARGAHFTFHPALPAWGMDAEADLVVTSVHKTGGAIEQSSASRLQYDRVSPEALKQREDLLGTTSAASLTYAALDGWRRQMVERGRELPDAALQRAERIRSAAATCPGSGPWAGRSSTRGSPRTSTPWRS
jgi:arginine/lysine/ornithine decarboxylase